MERISITPRQNWGATLSSLGFDWYVVDGIPCWEETAYYKFTAEEVDRIEAAANTLHRLCMEAVDHIVSMRLYPLLGIAPDVASLIAESWARKDPCVYGRFDLMYDGVGEPKLLEYNADTPTALFEASIVQWNWQQEVFPKLDQFNSIHEGLVARWRNFLVGRRNANMLHVTCVTPMPEDETTVQYIGQCAKEAGYKVKFLPIQEMGWDEGRKVFADLDNAPMTTVFKLYPWEWIVKESFGGNIKRSVALFVEPIWKMLLSNKGLLPILWDMYPEHPNLLPAFRTSSPFAGKSYVRKAMLGREGANITIEAADGKLLAETGGSYANSGFVYQQYMEPPTFDGRRANIGAWIVGSECRGMGVREDSGIVISNTSRFVPHVF